MGLKPTYSKGDNMNLYIKIGDGEIIYIDELIKNLNLKYDEIAGDHKENIVRRALHLSLLPNVLLREFYLEMGGKDFDNFPEDLLPEFYTKSKCVFKKAVLTSIAALRKFNSDAQSKRRDQRVSLLTKEEIDRLPQMYSQEDNPNPLCLMKFFIANVTWYSIEYDVHAKLFFGYAVIQDAELGYFSLEELEELVINGLRVEKDLHFKPTKLSEIKKLYMGEIK